MAGGDDEMKTRAGEPEIVFEPLHDDVGRPDRATGDSAGYDLRAYLRGRSVRVYRAGDDRTAEERVGEDAALRLEPGDRALVPTGFRARLPPGHEAQVRIRSSLAFREGLVVPNAPGTIDADYPDEWFVLVLNAGPRPVTIRHGDRVAQAVMSRYEVLPWRRGEVGVSTDRTGGIGSTG